MTKAMQNLCCTLIFLGGALIFLNPVNPLGWSIMVSGWITYYLNGGRRGQ